MTIIYKITKDCTEQELNLLGKDGWELIAVDNGIFQRSCNV